MLPRTAAWRTPPTTIKNKICVDQVTLSNHLLKALKESTDSYNLNKRMAQKMEDGEKATLKAEKIGHAAVSVGARVQRRREEGLLKHPSKFTFIFMYYPDATYCGRL